ncbi:MAG: hypothetical protein WCF39_10225, partial [Pseudolabrys sp.]
IKSFGYVAQVDLVVINPATIFFAPTVNTFVRAIYHVDATYIDQRFDARIGFHDAFFIGGKILETCTFPNIT